MKWCIFVNRRCCGDDCVGWVNDNCFIHLLLPHDYTDKQSQTEFDWSKDETLKADNYNSPNNTDNQLSFLEELEMLIVERNISNKRMQ